MLKVQLWKKQHSQASSLSTTNLSLMPTLVSNQLILILLRTVVLLPHKATRSNGTILAKVTEGPTGATKLVVLSVNNLNP